MEILFYERKKVVERVQETDEKGKKVWVDVEVEKDVGSPFETHEHELLSSVAKRYARRIQKERNLPEPPPGVQFFLRNYVRGLALDSKLTVGEALKNGTLMFGFGVR